MLEHQYEYLLNWDELVVLSKTSMEMGLLEFLAIVKGRSSRDLFVKEMMC